LLAADYQRRTLVADALIAGSYLAGTNTRRVRRALASLFGGAVGKDTVSRVWRKVKTDWDAWNARSLAEEPIVRLILDGTVVRVRLDRKATSISLLIVIGVREDGQKVLLESVGRRFILALEKSVLVSPIPPGPGSQSQSSYDLRTILDPTGTPSAPLAVPVAVVTEGLRVQS